MRHFLDFLMTAAGLLAIPVSVGLIDALLTALGL